MKSHTHTQIAFILLQNAKNSCPHQPRTTLSPPVAEPVVIVIYIPELTELDLLVRTVEGLTYLEYCSPGCQHCCCQPSTEHLHYASTNLETVPIPYISTDTSEILHLHVLLN